MACLASVSPSPNVRQCFPIAVLVEFIASSVLPAATAASKIVLRAAWLAWTLFIAEWRDRDPTSRRCHARAGCAKRPAGPQQPRLPRWPPCRPVSTLSQRRLLGVVSKLLVLVPVASWSTVLVPGLLDLVLKSARRRAQGTALLQSSVSQNLVLAVPMCTLVYALALNSWVRVASLWRQWHNFLHVR
jgi:hypothetical protein